MNEKPRLSKLQLVLLGIHTWLAIVFVVAGFIEAGGSDGFEDLARFATALLAGIYLIAIGTTAAIERYLVASELARTVLSIAAPPVAIVIFVLAVRSI